MRTLKALAVVVVFGVFVYLANSPRVIHLPAPEGGYITGFVLYADTVNSPGVSFYFYADTSRWVIPAGIDIRVRSAAKPQRAKYTVFFYIPRGLSDPSINHPK